ncbi:MAG: hypothetical protein JSC189_001311 [Candidatus Tokpelaia sp. JSC189]|nr:MAG: hypothetical protein JSC189_001311 [Candidatus Tokpelaia sp. JSC189]
MKELSHEHRIKKGNQLDISVLSSLRLCLLGSVFLSGCSSLDYSRLDGGLNPSDTPVTVDAIEQNNQIKQLGAQEHLHILATYGGVYHDTGVERMVARIVGKLKSVSENPDQTYHITILDTSNINAFALPGGYIYITRGLLALANDSAEIAAVIAHEMAHITINHGILRQQKEAEFGLANQVATKILRDRPTGKDSMIHRKFSLAQFFRNQELQADEIGIKMITEAGYDAFASPRFLQTMEAYARFKHASDATVFRFDFLATHPATSQRIQLAIAQARKISASVFGAIDRTFFLKGINGMIFGNNAAKGYIRGNNFIHPELGIMFSVPADFIMDNFAATIIASGPNDLAIRFDSVLVQKETLPVQYMKSGWVSGLDITSIQPLVVNGLSGASARVENDKWQFDIVVFVIKDRAYRFLTAAPRNAKNFLAISQETTKSFRMLSAREKASFRPLRIHVIPVKSDETVPSLAERMQGTDKKIELFRIINGLTLTTVLSAGNWVKIISE